MPRSARFLKCGYCYHLINRGNNGARIFYDTADYQYFVDLMRRAQKRIHVPLLAACLMPNHLHLVVRPVENSHVSRWMQWVFTAHVKRHSKKYGMTGRIWAGAYKSFPIQQDNHLLTVMRYVERNPRRSNLVKRAQDWRWGSLHWRLLEPSPVELSAAPIALPGDWAAYVDEPQTPAELKAIRKCVNQQRPFGEPRWIMRETSSPRIAAD